MKLLVVTAGYYDRDFDQKLERLRYSAKKFDIPLTIFGQEEKTFLWYKSKIVDLYKLLNSNRVVYTHALYTDGADSLFLGDLAEIMDKYAYLGSPDILTAAEKNCHPFPEYAEYFGHFGEYNNMNPGNFIGRIDKLMEALQVMKKYDYLPTNDQGHWYKAVCEDGVEVKLDRNALIFQTMSDVDFDKTFVNRGQRFINKKTKNAPTIMHFNGPKGEGTENDRVSQIVFDTINF